MKKYNFILVLSLLISGCAKIPSPSLISPSENNNLKNVNYGNAPSSYQKILKDYLISNLKNYKTAKVEFINEPAKLTLDHLGSTYSGYRVCLSINEQRGDYYIGYRNHLFLINNDNVDLHLYDSGLLTIPFEYCITRDTSKEIFIDEIPDEKDEVMVEKMDEIKISKIDRNIEVTGNIFISCEFGDIQRTYVFNESNRAFKMINKLEETDFEVDFNEAFIVAKLGAAELTINRVTGKATMLNDSQNDGRCRLTDKTKF